MRLPRWLLVVLLSCCPLSILAFACWIWNGWPERTMREFSRLLVAEKLEDVNAMIPAGLRWARMRRDGRWWLLVDFKMNAPVYYLSPEDRRGGFRYDQLHRVPRSVSDWCTGRASFRVHTLEFTVQRGKVLVQARDYNSQNSAIPNPGLKIIGPGYRADLENLIEGALEEEGRS